MPKKISPPSSEWLAEEWYLPPRGKGRGSPSIAKELCVSKRTVLRWLKHYGITEDAQTRRTAHRTGKATWSKDRPSKDELEKLYLMPPDGDGYTLERLGAYYDVNRQTVTKWLRHYGLSQSFSVRHSIRMHGEGNAAYKDGSSNGYHKNVLKRSGKPKRCMFCKKTDDLQVHHMDHDTTNGDESNLEWLCGTCNRLESNLWALPKEASYKIKSKGDVVVEITITFQE